MDVGVAQNAHCVADVLARAMHTPWMHQDNVPGTTANSMLLEVMTVIRRRRTFFVTVVSLHVWTRHRRHNRTAPPVHVVAADDPRGSKVLFHRAMRGRHQKRPAITRATVREQKQQHERRPLAACRPEHVLTHMHIRTRTHIYTRTLQYTHRHIDTCTHTSCFHIARPGS